MNEKELKKEIVEIFKKYKSVEDIGTRLIMLGFQKGKLEAEKEDKNKQDEFYNEFDLASNCSKDDKLFKRLWNKYFGEEK